MKGICKLNNTQTVLWEEGNKGFCSWKSACVEHNLVIPVRQHAALRMTTREDIPDDQLSPSASNPFRM